MKQRKTSTVAQQIISALEKFSADLENGVQITVEYRCHRVVRSKDGKYTVSELKPQAAGESKPKRKGKR